MDRRKFLKGAAQTAAVSVAAITGRTQSADAQEASDDDHDHPPVPFLSSGIIWTPMAVHGITERRNIRAKHVVYQSSPISQQCYLSTIGPLDRNWRIFPIGCGTCFFRFWMGKDKCTIWTAGYTEWRLSRKRLRSNQNFQQ